MRKRVERDSGTHCVKSVNWVGQCIKYELFFPKVHFFLILQLCLAPFFNFFPLSDLKYNLSQMSGKIGFFREKSDFFWKMSKFFDFSPKFFQSIFSMDFFFHSHRKPKNR